jgi:hypothetical protein
MTNLEKFGSPHLDIPSSTYVLSKFAYKSVKRIMIKTSKTLNEAK